jgi:hypothetical protein
MDIINQYIARAREIIGNRTPEEIEYDNEVVRWLQKGEGIRKAIAKANETFPSEALEVTEEVLADVQAHYKYLAEHEEIIRKLYRDAASILGTLVN